MSTEVNKAVAEHEVDLPRDFDALTILGRAAAEAARQAAEKDALKKRQAYHESLLIAWMPLRHFDPIKAAVKGKPAPTRSSLQYCKRLAKRIVAFASKLSDLRKLERLNAMSPSHDANKAFALAVLKAAAAGDEATVVRLLQQAAKLPNFWPPVWDWIQHGLPEEILGDACPNCGGLRKPDDWNRLCEACRKLGELAVILVSYRTSPIAPRNVKGIAQFEFLLREVFGHEQITAATLDDLEDFLDRRNSSSDDTLHDARERWLHSMDLADAIALLEQAKAEPSKSKPGSNDFLVRIGEAYLEELLTAKAAEVVLHPEEAELREWLASDCVDGKFRAWWHQRIANAHEWRLEVSPAWAVIADCLDILFPGTSNTFNVVGSRRCVEEQELFAYLDCVHGIHSDDARLLTIPQLASMLQQDCSVKRSAAATGGDSIPPASAQEQGTAAGEATHEQSGESLKNNGVRANERPATSSLSEFSHSPDFCCVNWGLQQFIFNVRQAACVCVMWQATQEGHPHRIPNYILNHAKEIYKGTAKIDDPSLEGLKNVERLRDVFKINSKKNHPAWGTMIVSSGGKAFGLVPPPPENSRQIPT